MNAVTIVGTGGLTSGSRSIGTLMAARGKGLGWVPSGMVKVVPAYTMVERVRYDGVTGAVQLRLAALDSEAS